MLAGHVWRLSLAALGAPVLIVTTVTGGATTGSVHRPDQQRSVHRTVDALAPRAGVVARAVAPTRRTRPPVPHPAAAPARRPLPHEDAPRPHRHHESAPAPGPTDWADLNAAIDRIPNPAARRVRWVVSNRYGHWGTADWYAHVIYISPTTPSGLLYSVAVHEWSHLLAVEDYDDDVSAAVKAINARFGGSGSSGYNGVENAADCMSIEQGATWTHYTSCHDAHWRSMARRLLAGHRL